MLPEPLLAVKGYMPNMTAIGKRRLLWAKNRRGRQKSANLQEIELMHRIQFDNQKLAIDYQIELLRAHGS